jgi:hypothetical protein
MPDSFRPSEPVTIRQIDAKEFDPTRIDEDVKARYGTLQKDVARGLEISRRPPENRYDDVLQEGQELLRNEYFRLQDRRADLASQNKEMAVQNIDKQIAAVQAILHAEPDEFKDMMRNRFEQLGSLKVQGLDSVIRSVAFGRAFVKSPPAREMAAKVSDTPPNFDSLAEMDALVSHLVNNEVYKDFFESDKGRKSFAQLTDTTALRKQIAKLQAGAATGRSSLQFVPSRGLLLELSGHIGDACWASKYESIAKEFPNISALTFVRDPGSAVERMVGSCLLIDTTDETTGEPVLVIRGINPIENYINKVKVDEFTEALTSYINTIAGGRKVAYVFDKQTGGATTNRPLFHNYFVNDFRAAHATGSPLKLPADTTFNDYTLSPESGSPAYATQ